MYDYDCLEWKEARNGNRLLIDDGTHVATVYLDNNVWRVIINQDAGSDLLAPKYTSLDDAINDAERAYHKPGSVPITPKTCAWQRAKKDHNGAPSYYIRSHGKAVTVRKAGSGSWYANLTDPIEHWFRTAQDAMDWVDACFADED